MKKVNNIGAISKEWAAHEHIMNGRIKITILINNKECEKSRCIGS